MGDGGSWQLDAGYTFHQETGCSDVSSVRDRYRYNSHWIGGDSHWQQCDISHILINTVYWLHKPCNVPSLFDRVSKKLSVKADVFDHSHMLGVCGQCQNLALMLKLYKLNFSSCAIRTGFCKSRHIYHNKLLRASFLTVNHECGASSVH